MPGGLFTGESLTLLVDLRPFTNQGYLCRVTDAASDAFARSDRGYGQLVQFKNEMEDCTSEPSETPFYPLKHA